RRWCDRAHHAVERGQDAVGVRQPTQDHPMTAPVDQVVAGLAVPLGERRSLSTEVGRWGRRLVSTPAGAAFTTAWGFCVAIAVGSLAPTTVVTTTAAGPARVRCG